MLPSPGRTRGSSRQPYRPDAVFDLEHKQPVTRPFAPQLGVMFDSTHAVTTLPSHIKEHIHIADVFLRQLSGKPWYFLCDEPPWMAKNESESLVFLDALGLGR